jgi:hypothetical protein
LRPGPIGARRHARVAPEAGFIGVAGGVGQLF